MLTARTVLKKGNTFIPIEEWKGAIEDPEYVEGAIILTLNGKIILDESLWDDVNWFWPYIANGLPDILEGKDFQTGLPDQPITFSVKHLNDNWLLLHVFSKDRELVKVKIKKNDYLSEMARGAIDFISRIEEIAPGSVSSIDHYMELLSDVANKSQNGSFG
ncbi:hypothetical protein PO883_00120 [Massilia sp. DJPM01]|uniref:hypothetical protein n=1 Tax=Massilia sp. DJPM01 TaxID=3024404 RepID=UPI00259F752D|nr:hypothetical protein [Massilia sp. DJPM01]MDM5175616.1 hypothetical protein [Massilia sp. DJPM01]